MSATLTHGKRRAGIPSESGIMGSGSGVAARPRPRGRSQLLDDLDVVRHAGDAEEAGDMIEGDVALILVVDVARERDPAVLDVDVEVAPGDLRIPDQPLQRGAAHL